MDDSQLDDWQEDVFNLGKKQKERVKKSAEEFRQLLRDYQYVFSGPRGQRVFWDLLDQSYMFFPYEQHNASSYVKEGRREIGLYLLAAVGFRPDPSGLAMLAKSLMGNIKGKMEEKEDG